MGNLVAIAGMVSQIGFGAFLKWWFMRPGGYWHKPAGWVVCGKLALVVIQPLVLLSTDNAYGFLLAYVFERFAYAPQTYWVAVAKGLCCDEDTSKQIGRRREGLFVGMQHSTQAFMGIVSVLYIMSAEYVFGLDTTSCWGEEQPGSAVAFIRYTFALVLPILGISTAALVHSFPIKGERLVLLEQKVAELCEREGKGSKGGAAADTRLVHPAP